MAFTEPSLLPEWVSDNPPLGPVDPTSSQTAVAEPSAAKKGTGFTYQEKPTRQDHNWLFNLIWLWVQWIKQQIDGLWTNQSAVLTHAGLTPDIETQQLLPALKAQFFSQYFCGGFNFQANGSNLEVDGGVCSTKGLTASFMASRNNSAWPGSGIGAMVKTPGIFASGTGNGGLSDSLSPISTGWYYVFIIQITGPTTIDVAFDNNPEGSNIAADITPTYFRRIGAFYYNAVINPIYRNSRYTHMQVPLRTLFTGLTTSGVATLLTLDCPKLSSIVLNLAVKITWSSAPARKQYVCIESGLNPLTAPTLQPYSGKVETDEVESFFNVQVVPIIDSGSPKVRYIITDSTAGAEIEPNTIEIFVLGFWDYAEYELANPW